MKLVDLFKQMRLLGELRVSEILNSLSVALDQFGPVQLDLQAKVCC